jgi:1-acyl-sn-glycerol-3-phosphate acyltransferase
MCTGEESMSDTPPQDAWPATPGSRWGKPITHFLLRLVCRYHVLGRENFPAEPPYIIVSNHMSFWDIPAINTPPPVPVIGMAARKYQGTWREPLFTLFPVIWVEQFSADRRALQDSISVLKGGGVLGVAPEGTRSKTGQLIQGRSGVAFIATRAEVPIVPAALWGTEKIMKRPRPHVYARFGKPFRLPEGRAKGDQLDAYTERIMCAIAALLPESYHGVYAGNPLIEEMRQLVC